MSWALAAAVGASLAYGVSTLMQAVAARRASGLAVLARPLAVGGLVLDGLAALASLVALDRLPLFVVQGIVAASLVVVVLAAPAVLPVPWRGADVAVAGVVVVALLVLTVAAGDEPARRAPDGFAPAALLAAVALVAALAAAYRHGPPWLLALLAGLGYSGAAIAARALEGGRPWHPALVVALLASGAVGVVAYLRALEAGAVGAVAATVALVEVLVPGVVGVSLLGDGVRDGWAPVALAASLVALAGCVLLARSSTTAAAEG